MEDEHGFLCTVGSKSVFVVLPSSALLRCLSVSDVMDKTWPLSRVCKEYILSVIMHSSRSLYVLGALLWPVLHSLLLLSAASILWTSL